MSGAGLGANARGHIYARGGWMDAAEIDAARESLGWRWPVQQALWNLVREGDITTWTDAVMLTEEVASVLRGNGYEVVATTFDRDSRIRVDDLMLGATEPKKVVHHEGCGHARTAYVWARETGDAGTFAVELVASGAWRWHRFCQRCCGDLDDLVKAAVRDAQEACGGRL